MSYHNSFLRRNRTELDVCSQNSQEIRQTHRIHADTNSTSARNTATREDNFLRGNNRANRRANHATLLGLSNFACTNAQTHLPVGVSPLRPILDDVINAPRRRPKFTHQNPVENESDKKEEVEEKAKGGFQDEKILIENDRHVYNRRCYTQGVGETKIPGLLNQEEDQDTDDVQVPLGIRCETRLSSSAINNQDKREEIVENIDQALFGNRLGSTNTIDTAITADTAAIDTRDAIPPLSARIDRENYSISNFTGLGNPDAHLMFPEAVSTQIFPSDFGTHPIATPTVAATLTSSRLRQRDESYCQHSAAPVPPRTDYPKREAATPLPPSSRVFRVPHVPISTNTGIETNKTFAKNGRIILGPLTYGSVVSPNTPLPIQNSGKFRTRTSHQRETFLGPQGTLVDPRNLDVESRAKYFWVVTVAGASMPEGVATYALAEMVFLAVSHAARAAG